MAKLCECDAVKFQKRTVEVAYTQEFLAQPRQSPWGATQREQKNGLEFGKPEYDAINGYCTNVGIPWFASAWDGLAQQFLKQYNCKYNKVASVMATNYQHIMMVVEEQKPTFVSTAKVNQEQLDAITDIFKAEGVPLTLMHCVASYPTSDEKCNLRMIPILKERYKIPVGFSSHNPSILPCSLAVSLGAEALEVHICLDRTAYGSDQSSSMEMMSLIYVVRDSKRVSKILGQDS